MAPASGVARHGRPWRRCLSLDRARRHGELQRPAARRAIRSSCEPRERRAPCGAARSAAGAARPRTPAPRRRRKRPAIRRCPTVRRPRELREQREKNCETARERSDRYTLSRRLFRTNAAGEREYLDDAAIDEARAKAAADVATLVRLSSTADDRHAAHDVSTAAAAERAEPRRRRARRDRPTPSLDAFFIPDFCAPRMVFAVVLIAELVAVTLALARPVGRFLTELARISLFLQWLGLTSAAAALLCAAVGSRASPCRARPRCRFAADVLTRR